MKKSDILAAPITDVNPLILTHLVNFKKLISGYDHLSIQ